MVAPTITNPDFETAGTDPGEADGWVVTSSVATTFEVAGFDGDTLGFEAYESGWGALSLEFLDSDLEAAEFENEPVEDYERVWGPFDGSDPNYATAVLAAANFGENTGFIFEFSLLASAQFDSAIVGQNFEDYADGWVLGGPTDVPVLAFVGAPVDLTPAAFGTGLADVEDYETEWLSNQTFIFNFVGIGTDLEAAEFGAIAPTAVEDYEDSDVDGDEVITVVTGVIGTYGVEINGHLVEFPSTLNADLTHVRDGLLTALQNANPSLFDVSAVARIGTQIVLKNLSTNITPFTLKLVNPPGGEIERQTDLFTPDRWLQPLLGL